MNSFIITFLGHPINNASKAAILVFKSNSFIDISAHFFSTSSLSFAKRAKYFAALLLSLISSSYNALNKQEITDFLSLQLLNELKTESFQNNLLGNQILIFSLIRFST